MDPKFKTAVGRSDGTPAAHAVERRTCPSDFALGLGEAFDDRPVAEPTRSVAYPIGFFAGTRPSEVSLCGPIPLERQHESETDEVAWSLRRGRTDLFALDERVRFPKLADLWAGRSLLSLKVLTRNSKHESAIGVSNVAEGYEGGFPVSE